MKGDKFIKWTLDCLFFFFEFGMIALPTKIVHYFISKVEIQLKVRIFSIITEEIEKKRKEKQTKNKTALPGTQKRKREGNEYIIILEGLV